MSTIKVLSYNTSWEASQPRPDWLTEKNPYNNPTKAGDGQHGIGYVCGRKEGNSFPGVEQCRNNIFSIIKSGNYDLVGMQEYIDVYQGEPVYRDRMATLKSEQNLDLVVDTVMLPTPWNGQGTTKEVQIGSLYKSTEFKLIARSHGEQFMRAKDNGFEEDGRPLLLLLLKHLKTKKYILFVNAHLPQSVTILTKRDKELNKSLRSAITHRIAEATNKLFENVQDTDDDKLLKDTISQNKVIVIFTTDSNDFNNTYIKDVRILGKPLYSGKNYRKTCCSSRVPPCPAHRFGDIIEYSENNNFTYEYPHQDADKGYSDHYPIATTLTLPGGMVTEETQPKTKGKKHFKQKTTNPIGGKRKKRKRTRRKKKKTKKRRKRTRRKRRKSKRK
jgi:hypothetical protein